VKTLFSPEICRPVPRASPWAPVSMTGCVTI
jgi:hypothetical protein